MMGLEEFAKKYAREIGLVILIGLSLIELVFLFQQKRDETK